MSDKNYLFRLFVVFLVAFPLFLNGCSYIPWMGDEEEEDFAFEEDFPFEDEEPAKAKGDSSGEDDFFAEDGSLAESGGDDFSSIDHDADSVELKGDVKSLQTQQEALVSKVRELEEILATLEPKVSATQERLEGSLSSAATQSEFLQPEVEDLKQKVSQLHTEISRLKAGRFGGSGGSQHRGKTHRSPTTTPPEYNKALQAYRAGNYDESILLFQNYALSNPPQGLKDNILFWIGSNYVKLEMYDNAIKQFNTVLNQFPSSNKVHDSRLMLGVSYYGKGEASRAIEVLETALKYNPPSEVKGRILAQLNEIQ